MSERSISRVPMAFAVLALAVSLGACTPSPNTAWAGPGWYLELPYPVIAGGPAVFGGPFSYDKCEEERRNRRLVSDQMLCVNETKQPPKYGFY